MFLRSLLFSTGMVSTALVFSALGTLTAPLPFRVRYRFLTQWARLNLWWLAKTCGLDFVVEGIENVPRNTAAIVFCKHQSAWETLALQRVFPPHAWVLKRELMWVPFFGWGLAMLEPIAIDRKAGRRAIKQIISQGRARLDAGRWVVVFPEGTRVAPGQMRRFGLGGALLAEHTGYPVVPVAHNAGEFWPRRGFLKRRGTVRMVIGPAIETVGRRAEDINAEAEGWIRDTMRMISETPLKNN